MATESIRVWLVERTFSDDEQNIVIEIYATIDGRRYLRRERALTTFTGGHETRAALDVEADDLARVGDQDRRDRYAIEASRMRREHAPEDEI